MLLHISSPIPVGMRGTVHCLKQLDSILHDAPCSECFVHHQSDQAKETHSTRYYNKVS